MQFLYPYFLPLTLFPLILLFYTFTQKAQTIEAIFSKNILNKLRYREETFSKEFRYKVFLVTLSLFIVAFSRPILEEKEFTTTENKNSLVIAVDMSKSMNKIDIYPSRTTLAKQKLLHILEVANNLKIGVLFYAQNAYMLYPISEDKKAMFTLLKNAQIKQIFAPNTNLFAALEGSNRMLQKEHSKNILLLSDGGENIKREKELLYLKKNGLKLYTIALTQQNTQNITLLSKSSGGDFINYTWGDEDIKIILDKISTQVKTPTQTHYDIKHYKEYFTYPLLLALILLFFVYQPSFKLLKLFLLLSFLFVNSPTILKADILDFYTLYKAKEYYKNAKYKKSAIEYKKVASTPNTNYNYANALYKSKEYLQAIQIYKKALSEDKILNAKIYHNIANANMQVDKLNVAKSYLLKALAEHHFTQTEENLALLKKELQRRKKLLAKDATKVHFKNRLKQNSELTHTSSTYSIHLERLFLNEEEQWKKLLSKEKSPLFLQKISTTKRSDDADKPY